MRAKLLHPATLLALLALLVALDVPSQAARELGLARNSVTSKTIRNGTIKVADLSRRVRRLLARAGTPGPQGTQGPQGLQGLQGLTGPPGPAPTCPAGTALHELACIETAQRGLLAWNDARIACRNAGRRLPSVSELVSFEQRTEAFVPTVGSEWADGSIDFPNAADGEQGFVVRLTDGLASTAGATGVFTFRCVAQGTI